jgi:hypothetical protein
MLSDILNDIYAHDGWLSGSYVRERLVRQDMTTPVGDIDVIVTYPNLDSLTRMLIDKYDATFDTLDLNEDDGIAHYHFYIGEYTFDLFFNEDHSYLSPPDVDVNTLCWTGTEFTTWYIFSVDGEKYYRTGFRVDTRSDEEYYAAQFDIDSIIQRAKHTEAVALTREWDPDDYERMRARVMKLVNRGWTILNEF